MKVGIYSNLIKDTGCAAAIKTSEILKKAGVSFAFCDYMKSTACVNGITGFADAEFLPVKTLASKCDIIIVLGGDGTLLRVAQECALYGCKIFAVNMGSIGFLTEIEMHDLEKGIKLIVDGKYNPDERFLLEAEYNGKKFFALNEVVVTRGSRAKIMRIQLDINGVKADVISSDGIIVASPIGSTAYSLSAGGPIVSPDAKALCITPVSPQTLHSRPMVISDGSAVSITLLRADPCAYLNIDGEEVAAMSAGECVKIKKSELTVSFVRLEGYNLYKHLMKKLNFGSFPEEEV